MPDFQQHRQWGAKSLSGHVGFGRWMAHYKVVSQKQNRDGSGLKLNAVYFVVVPELHVASPESHSFD
jgi:hypothetical protein